MSLSEQESSLATQATPPLAKARLPKRLIALLLLYVAASVSGLIAKQGVLFCLLTLLMVLDYRSPKGWTNYAKRLYLSAVSISKYAASTVIRS